MENFIEIKNINPNQNEKKPRKKFNKKKLISIISFISILILIIIMIVLYNTITPFRHFCDKYIFRKIVSEEKLATIQLDYDSNINIIGYNRYICILAENKLRQYNASGELANELKIEISNPVYHVNNRYLVISEKGSSKVYLIEDNKLVWEKEIDGKVKKLTVNQNGYVAAILNGTTHKSVIATYDSKGNELFKTYLAKTITLDAEISPDNKYLALAEINTSGTQIQSKIKIVSIEKAQEKDNNNETDSFIYNYNAEANSLITNIEYQNKNRLICMYDDKIHIITDNKDEEIMKLQEENKKINYADIKLTNYAYRAVEKSTGFFQANTEIEMINLDNKKTTTYTIEGVAKNIYSYDNIIAVNLGQEIEFFNTSGWMMKQYTSSQDIQDIKITNGLAGVIYRDKVELINL